MRKGMDMTFEWLWCPECQRAFRPVAKHWQGERAISATCTYEGCEGRSGVPWERMRTAQSHFPVRPVLNTVYERTPKRDVTPKPRSARPTTVAPETVNRNNIVATTPPNRARVAQRPPPDQYCQVCHIWKSPSAFRSSTSTRCDDCWRQAPVSDRFKGRPYDGI